jgi:4-amino-4-deoxy-L-arabinose transferase-like glycosyltransferase
MTLSAPNDAAIAQSRQREIWLSVLWVAVVSGIAFFWGLASTGLVDETEPLFAEAARQMYETGDWITPYFNDVTRFDKPPLVYWLMAVGFHLFGVNEWTVRLPSALSAAGLVGLGFWTLRRFGFSRPELATAYAAAPTPDRSGSLSRLSQRSLIATAVIGSALIALNPETIVWGRIGVSDMLLTSCIGSALFAFFLGYGQPSFPQRQRNWYLASYALMALAVLTKGPVGVGLPGLIIAGFWIYLEGPIQGIRAALQEMHVVKGSLLFLVMTVPWFVLVTVANGQAYIDSFFGYHNFERFTDVVNGHSAPWYFYFLVVTVGFLPWSPVIPWAIARLKPLGITYWRSQPRQGQLGLFALIWFVVIFVFFTVAVTKLPSYVLPLMPAAAVLVSLAWSDRLCPAPGQARPSLGFRISLGLSLLFLGILAFATFYSPNWMGDDPAMPDLPDQVRASGIMLRAAIIWTLALVAGIALVVTQRGRWLWSVKLIAFAAFVLMSLLPAYQLADQIRQQPLRSIAALTLAVQQPGEPIYMVGFMKPSLVFYTQRLVTYIYEPDEMAQALAEASAGTALLVGTPAEIDQVDWPADQQESLLTEGTYALVRLGLPGSGVSGSGV